MEIAAYISLVVLGIILVAALVGRRLELRNRPHCPVHKKPMELFGDMEYDEFVCSVKGCTWCADIYDDGSVHYFST